MRAEGIRDPRRKRVQKLVVYNHLDLDTDLSAVFVPDAGVTFWSVQNRCGINNFISYPTPICHDAFT